MVLSSACSDEKEEDPTAAWVGHTYVLQVPGLSWIDPSPSLGENLEPFVPQFVMKVTGNSGSNLDVTLGTATSGVQDLCNPTTSVSTTETYPAMKLGPADLKLHLKHFEDPIEVFGTARNFTLTNVLPPRDMGELVTTLDAREFFPLVTVIINAMPDSVCTSFEEQYMSPCEPCPHDGEPYCVTIRAIELAAAESDIDLVPVDASVVDDPACVKIPETP